MSTSSSPTPGKIGQGLNFNGTSNYVDIGDSFYSDKLTVCAWVKPAADVNANNFKGLVDKRNTSGASESAGSREWQLGYSSGSGFQWTSYDGTNVVLNILPGGIFPTVGKWFHVCAVQNGNGNTGYLYVNGAQIGSAVQTGTTANTTSRIQIGARTGSSDSRWLAGAVDDVRIYNRALSAQEVAQLYNSTK